MNSAFSPKFRKLSIIFSFLFCFICLILVRYLQGNIYKIVMLYASSICLMYLVVIYKNSINKYEIGIFCFLCVQLFVVAPTPFNIDGLVSTSYLLSYRYGVSSRSLIATIVDFFTNNGFISKYFVWHFIFCTTIFLSFIISVYLGTIIQKAKEDIKIFLIFLSFLYLSCFTAPSAYFSPSNFGRLEIFAFLFILLFAFIINKGLLKLQWLIPLLALLVMATHLILVFFYIPLIIIMLLYVIFTKKDKNKYTIFILVATIVLILIAFFSYIVFYKKTFVFANALDFFRHLNAKTDLNFSEYFIHMTLFAELQEHLDGWKSRIGFTYSGNLSILINIPFVFLFVAFWLKCLRRETQRVMKFFFLLPILILLYQSIAFFMFFDFGRWVIMIMNCQFIMVFYLAFVRNETVVSIAQNINLFFKEKYFFVILVCLFMVSLGPLNYISPSDRIMRLADYFLDFLRLIRSLEFFT